MSSFAQDLATRLTGHSSFWSSLRQLQASGLATTLERWPSNAPVVEEGAVLKLLYCASVFVQTDDDRLKGVAQTIALNALLVNQDARFRERGLHILTELGNFPGLLYAEREIGGGDESLLGALNRGISLELNTVPIGPERIALTDYQKRVWESLRTPRPLAITAPTSAGKSFLVIEHLCKLAEELPTLVAVYVAPTRALLSEVHSKVQSRLKGVDEIRISSVPTLDPLNRARQIFVLTQERLQVLLSVYGGTLDIVIVDEAQNLADAARGMILQDCLEAVASRGQNTRFILLAPGAVGLPTIAKSMGIEGLASESTVVTPVLQNRIVISKVKGSPDEMSLSLLRGPGDQIELGNIKSALGLEKPSTRLAAVALELGAHGGSLVYETGPSEAEKTALQLMNGIRMRAGVEGDASLDHLAKFIREHIHPEYQLATMAAHGVAYHYGRMPSLLREAIEESFRQKQGGLRYVVCTTTLAQGINLPARNVFIDTPTRGRGEPLDPAVLWNFAGRAGRLNQDIVGNVFLLDYDTWTTRPMDEFAPFEVRSAITATLDQDFEAVVNAVKGEMPAALPWDVRATKVRACAGLLISKAATGRTSAFLATVIPPNRANSAAELIEVASEAFERVGLPRELLVANWMIDPYGLRRLYDRMLEKIEDGDLEALIPLNPHDAPDGLYQRIFTRILSNVYGRKGRFGALVAGLAIPWMKGMPYPVILSRWVRSARIREEKERAELSKPSRKKPRSIDALIREAFTLIEDVVRFQFVQLGKAYQDLLVHALRVTKNGDRVPDVYDFALALELGISTRTGTAFVELGISRISASALEDLFPNSSMTTKDAREALRSLDVRANSLSPVIIDELGRLGLLEVELA